MDLFWKNSPSEHIISCSHSPQNLMWSGKDLFWKKPLPTLISMIMFFSAKLVDGSEDTDTEFHKGQRRKTPTIIAMAYMFSFQDPFKL